jgi:hypothetical protein
VAAVIRWRERTIVMGAIAVGVLLWFGGWLLASEPRMGGDVLTEFYPWLVYGRGQLARGALPLWGPYCGRPHTVRVSTAQVIAGACRRGGNEPGFRRRGTVRAAAVVAGRAGA